MYPTVEVRWFYEGMVPPAVLQWFQQADQELVQQPPRMDYYLRITDREGLGIKLREGRIEIKQRHQQLGIVRFHERVAGAIEYWRKWSFELGEMHGGLAVRAAVDSSWIGVSKARGLRRYRLTGERKVVAMSTEAYADRGCDLELTNVRVGEKAWWSLSFEAFGSEPTLRENLLLVAKQVFAIGEPPALDARDSCGYPKWLMLITQDRENR